MKTKTERSSTHSQPKGGAETSYAHTVAAPELFLKPLPHTNPVLVRKENDPLEQEADRLAGEAVKNTAHSENMAPVGTPAWARAINSFSTSLPETTKVATPANLSGQALPDNLRVSMEEQLQADFSTVRIHTNEKAAEAAEQLHAQAFTYGSHIFFGAGKYQPDTEEGQLLLAHELAHVKQQADGIRRKEAPGEPPENAALAAENMPPPTAPPLTPEANIAAPKGEAATPSSDLDTLLIPPPPDTLDPVARARLRQTSQAAGTAAQRNAELPTADSQTSEARQGVTEPSAETEARAEAGVTESLANRLAPSPEIEELCANIRRAIRAQRPADEDSLLQADPSAAAEEVGNQLNDDIDADTERVGANYEALEAVPPGEAEQIAIPPTAVPASVTTPDINAAAATPSPLTEEEVSLEADVEAATAQIEGAGMNSQAGQLVQDGPIAAAREAQGELADTAAIDPAQVMAEQEASLLSARADLDGLQEQALATLAASRAATVESDAGQQLAMIGSEEEQRAALAARAETLFSEAQESVSTLLAPLSATAMAMWEAGQIRISTDFENELARVQAWIDERHEGVGGALLEIWDDWTGFPDWVTRAYNQAETLFGDEICDLIREISAYVNSIVVSCEEIIDNTDAAIQQLFDSAPAELQVWAEEQKSGFQGRLEGLREQVSQTQQDFNRDLVERAATAVQEVREQVHALREKAKGILGRMADALAEFLEDPARAILNGLLSLVGIEPASFWALLARIDQVVNDIADDPLGFAGKLLQAVGDGFQLFFDNFVAHFFDGLVNWLFSGLGQMGIQVPRELSLEAIVTFFLELMGITWERIRALLARHIGEENVALLEQAFELISDLIALGPRGVFELLKEQLDPRNILDTIIQMAVDFVVETLITQATLRIIALFNPVGAIVQAIEAIYKVLKWIFQNAARIFSLVETVVNGMAEIVAGNFGRVAQLVESALVQLMVPVIDFIAEFLSLGGLPERVADAVRGLQAWVEGILDRVIGWLADRARAILAALGIGGAGEGKETTTNLEDTEVGERLGFSAAEEQHHLWLLPQAEGTEIMMASTPSPIDQVLSRLRQLAQQKEISEADEALDAIVSERALLQTQASLTTEKMLAAQAEGATAEDIAAASAADAQTVIRQRALADALRTAMELIDPPMPQVARFDPGFSGAAASHFSARQVANNPGNHGPGSEPRKGKNGHLAEAFEVISNLGQGGVWVRFHLFNHNIGGQAANSNLIPTLRIDNTSYENQFERPMKDYHDRGIPVWFLGTATYYTNTPLFVRDYQAVGGGMKYQNGQWIEDTNKEIPTFTTAPGQPTAMEVHINDILQDDMLMWNTVANLTPITLAQLDMLKSLMPAGGFLNRSNLLAVVEANFPQGAQRTRLVNILDRLNLKF